MFGVPSTVRQEYDMSDILADACHTIIRPFIQAVVRYMQEVLPRSMMNSYFKTRIFKSNSYLNYIRSLNCVACDDRSNTVEAHHEGFGVKAYGNKKYIPDSYALPLCCACHVPKRHAMGYHSFWKRVNLDPKLIVIHCLTKYIDGLQCRI